MDGSMIRLMAVVGAFMIAFSAIFVRLADVSPTTAAFFRVAYAFPILLVVALLSARDVRRPWPKRLRGMAAGLIMATGFVLWNHAIGFIGAGLSTVLGNTQVVFVGLGAWWVYNERPRTVAFVAIPVVLSGALFISGLGGEGAYGSAPLLGVLFGLANALFYASFLLVFRSVSETGRATAWALVDVTAGASVGALALGLLTDPNFSLAPHWPAHGWLFALALGPQIIGWMLISQAMPRLLSLETSAILLLQPLGTVVLGRLIFQELLSPLQWAGVGLILVGVTLLNVRLRRQVEPDLTQETAAVRETVRETGSSLPTKP
ncbi:MAG: DMT family transporter [Trueperaceae bacterium]|nr:DMT family transporter [Trueperaceae bacterium]